MHKSILLGIAVVLFAMTPLCAFAKPSQSVTLKSLLAEMTDRDSIASWPSPAFTMRQSSSYDRHRVAPDKPGWYANDDFSNYIRTETNDGRTEQVMMDADGPGAVVRFVMTNGGPLDARVRVYLDNSPTPTIMWPASDLSKDGPKVGPPLQMPHPPPLGHGGATFYLPIPYAKHCKITLEEPNPSEGAHRYYQVDYRTYAAGTNVITYSDTQLAGARSSIERANSDLAHPDKVTPRIRATVTLSRVLQPGESASVDLPAGAAAVRRLELNVGADLTPDAREQALRSVVLRGQFDSEPESIWCAVGEFEGSGAGGRPMQSWYRTVGDHGVSISRWTMPYMKSGRFTLENLGTTPVTVSLAAGVGTWHWDDRSMYFHCDWRQQYDISTRPFSDWNFDTMTGRGILVGDVLSVFNPIPRWYGEGDEKIWIDGESFPSTVGTGTEDYYNASWAPNPIFDTPFANHPRIDQEDSQGQNVYTRSRNLDGVPFQKSMKFETEILTWDESKVDYTSATYWYGAPSAKSSITPEQDEAKRAVAK